MLPEISFFICLVLVCLLVLRTRKLTLVATFVAAVIATLLYFGLGMGGVVLLGAFFIMGVMATRWRKNENQIPDTDGENSEQRDAKQVMANGGVSALLAIAAMLATEYLPLFLLMTACACASAAADTVSSELGLIYGRKAYDILTLRKAQPGDNGLVSLEGSFAGLMASGIIAAVYCFFTEWGLYHFLIIIAAGTAGNLFDSVLGATLERRRLIGNNAVNFLNTLLAALLGGLLVTGI